MFKRISIISLIWLFISFFTISIIQAQVDLETIFKGFSESIFQEKGRRRDLEQKQLSFFAKEVIEERRISEEFKKRLQAKYGEKRVDCKKQLIGRLNENGVLEIPPFARARIEMKTYCLDSGLPAPASNEKMYLIPIEKLLIKDFIPIYEKLMKYSASHPEKYYQVQRILWFMRNLSEERYIPLYDLVAEDKIMLEEIYPGSTKIIENVKMKILVKAKIKEFISEILPPEIKNVLRYLSNLGYDINRPPVDLGSANKIVAETLKIINAMKPKGEMEDYSEYTLLPNDLAVKTLHGGGASKTTLIVSNPTPEFKTLDFKQYVLESSRDTQRLGLENPNQIIWEHPGCEPSFEPWSFAIITDLHLGGEPSILEIIRKKPEYRIEPNERLKDVVDWINFQVLYKNNRFNIKFVVILGDITHNFGKRGFCKAREILDELKIPYIPLIGNHDVWSFTEELRSIRDFDEVFWTENPTCSSYGYNSNGRNFRKLQDKSSFKFERDKGNYKNFYFYYDGIHFIGLDFVSREPFKYGVIGYGVKPQAVAWKVTLDWLSKKLEEINQKIKQNNKNEKIILLAHHPMVEDKKLDKVPLDIPNAFSDAELSKINDIIAPYKDKILAQFAGHIHSTKDLKFYPYPPCGKYNSPLGFPVYITEALLATVYDQCSPIIRIVNVNPFLPCNLYSFCFLKD